MRRYIRLLLGGSLVVLALLAVASVAAAQLSYRSPDRIIPPYRSMHVSVDILVEGRPVPTVYHRGRTYLPVSRLGQEYEIRVRNHGSRRIAAVVSVDGLSVISRRPASTNDAGYLVEPYGSITIPGWTRDSSTVAAFRFEDRYSSEAASRGHAENVGVIGVVAFEELSRYPRPLVEDRDRPVPFPRADGSGRAAEGLNKMTPVPSRHSEPAEVGGTGTAAGRDVDFRTYEVPFVRSGNRRDVTIYYDTVDNLRRAGVPVDRPYPWPRPFPVEG